MHPVLRPLGLALLALALVSCNTPPKRQSFPEITFQHLQPFRLDVARVQIVDGYQPDPGADIGSQFPEAPAAVARQWAEDPPDRRRAAGRGDLHDHAGQGDPDAVEALARHVGDDAQGPVRPL